MEIKIKLREFITGLEALADGGKNDELDVMIHNYNDEYDAIESYGLGEYPVEDEEDGESRNKPCVYIEL